MYKKSQIEILGMTLIIMFISLGILFLIKFNILESPTNVKGRFVHSELASSTLSTLLVTNVHECRGVNIRDLLIDCAEGQSILCNGSANPNSCDYSKHVIRVIFNDSLAVWEKDYKFTAWTDGDLAWVEDDLDGPPDYTECPKERKSALFFFETETKGTLFIRLDICR